MNNIKQAGCCSLCDKEVFEIVSWLPNDHPFAGRVAKVGKPLEDAVRVSLLTDCGNQVLATLCEACSSNVKEEFSRLWDRIVEGWEFEVSEEFHIIMNKKILNPKQKEQQGKWLDCMRKSFILEVLYREKWTEIYNGRYS